MKTFKNWQLTISGSILIVSLLALAGCAAWRYGAPPTALEQKFFDVKTNYVPVVSVQSNVVQVTLYRTNEVTIPTTNAVGVIEYHTNAVIVPVVQYQTNTVTVTNLHEAYNYGPNATTTGAEGVISAIPVYGTMASTALAVLAGVWGWLRSAKNRQTATNTMQVVQTMRQFIKSLPNGATYDNALMQWAQAHQADAGVLNNVLTLIESEVSNPDAQFAAQAVIATINGLTGGAVPPATPAAPKT